MRANRILSVIVSAGLIYQGIGFGGMSKNSGFVSFGDSGEDMMTKSSYSSVKENNITISLNNFKSEITDEDKDFKFMVKVKNRDFNPEDRFNLDIILDEDSCLTLKDRDKNMENIKLPNVREFNLFFDVDKVEEDKYEMITLVISKNVLDVNTGQAIKQEITRYQTEVFIKHMLRKAIIIIPGIAGSEIFSAKSQQLNGIQYAENHRIWPPEDANKFIPRKCVIDPKMINEDASEEENIEIGFGDQAEYSGENFEFEGVRKNAPKIFGIDIDRVLSDFKNLACSEDGESLLDTKESYPFDCRKEGAERFFGSADVYKDLAVALVSNNKLKDYNIIFFSYDWRRSNADTARELEDYIENNHFEDVVLIGHSMGGLVATAYLADPENRKHVDKFIALGTPFLGANKLISVVETGAFFDGLIGTLAAPIANDFVKELVKNCPGAYELLPPKQMVELKQYNVLEELSYNFTCCCFSRGPEIHNEVHAYDKYIEILGNRWRRDVPNISKFLDRAQRFHDKICPGGRSILLDDDINFYNIVGYGEETMGTSQIMYDIGDDGSASEITHCVTDGDGTVAFYSATINNTIPASHSYRVKEVSHLGMVSDKSIINLVSNIIINKPGRYDDSRIDQMFNK